MTITLRGIAWDHPRGVQGLIASAYPYRVQTGVQVEWVARSLKDFGDAPFDAMAREYDLLVVDHPHMGMAAATQCLYPLDECLSSEIIDQLARESAGPSHASYLWQGHLYCLAVDAAVHSAVYRPDLFTLSFPNSWDEVVAVARDLRGQGLWMALPLLPTDAISNFLTLTASLGAPVGKADPAIDREVGLRALDYLRQFYELSHPDSITWNPIFMNNAMSTAADIAYCPMTYSYSNYTRRGFAKFPVCYTTIPGVKGGVLGGAGFAVSAYSPHVQTACEYGAWLCSAEIQSTLYVENGGQPGNGAAWRAEGPNRLTQNFFLDTLPSMEAAYVRERHNGWHRWQEESGNLIHAFLRENGNAERCLDAMQRLYIETLD